MGRLHKLNDLTKCLYCYPRGQQDHSDRLADKDYDSFSSEDYDYLKVKIVFSLFGSPRNLNGDDN